VKIKINRPDPTAARQIFSIYLREDVPLAEDELDATTATAVRSSTP
jgi:SpoVK/Ycf46/Vps4 family AAA+-type ATPase